jgi:hypothetical protein
MTSITPPATTGKVLQRTLDGNRWLAALADQTRDDAIAVASRVLSAPDVDALQLLAELDDIVATHKLVVSMLAVAL